MTENACQPVPTATQNAQLSETGKTLAYGSLVAVGQKGKSIKLCARVTLQLVVTKAIRTVPYPLLGENTLVLSDSMVLAKDEKGQLALMFR